MLADLVPITLFWFFISLLGWVYLPLTKRLLGCFYDKGYLFSKVIGVAFSGYLVWLLASLKLVPFSDTSIWLAIALGVIVNGLIVTKSRKDRLIRTKITLHRMKVYLAEELVFFITLAFWSYVRGFQPDIQGLEKFMDYGFVNSILRSDFFPPTDMWYAGKTINYYYWGHYITAFLTKLSGLSSAITYNLMLGALFGFCFSLTFSLVSNLIYLWKGKLNLVRNFRLRVVLGGLLSALIITLGANLHPAYYNFKMGVLDQPYCDGATSYWYPNATRYIGYCPEVDDKTIHEFPSYSFVVSDLHGHVSNLPFVLTFLALLVVLMVNIDENKMKLGQLIKSHLPLSFLLAIFYMTNQWDYPIYSMVLGIALIIAYYTKERKLSSILRRAVPLGLALLLFSTPLVIPFQVGFENITKGIGLVRAHSLAYQLVILWGWGWFFGITLIWFLFFQNTKTDGKYSVPIINREGLIRWLARRLGVKAIIPNTIKETPTSNRSLITTSDLFVLVVFLSSVILIVIPEIIYVKDIYIPSYHRANTMFKLTYQAFVMLSILLGYTFVRVISFLKKPLCRMVLFCSYGLLFIACMIYPFYSIKGYYGQLATKNYKGLYGLNFLRRSYPDDYQAILWLNDNVTGQPVILEAAGDSYTDYERVSMATGLPTVEGWLVHEWLWRGSYDGPGARAAEIQSVYQTTDLTVAKTILNKYRVKYVVVGDMEKAKYPQLDEQKFGELGTRVFSSEGTSIYQIK